MLDFLSVVRLLVLLTLMALAAAIFSPDHEPAGEPAAEFGLTEADRELIDEFLAHQGEGTNSAKPAPGLVLTESAGAPAPPPEAIPIEAAEKTESACPTIRATEAAEFVSAPSRPASIRIHRCGRR